MPQNDFYNINENIAYPFQEWEGPTFPFGAATLQRSAVLDAGFIVGIDATYDPDYRIGLERLTVTALDVTFRFVDAASSATFLFVVPWATAKGTVSEIDADEGATFGHGFLVVGDMAALRADFADGVYTPMSPLYVEQAVIMSLKDHYVKQVTIATQGDTAWHLPTACGGSSTDAWVYTITARNLLGDIRLRPGYNATISVIEFSNAVEISAELGSGEGEACDRPPLSSQSSSSGTVGPAKCNEIFNTINGVWPTPEGIFSLTALSSGLKVEPYPDINKIIVRFMSGDNTPYCRA